MRPPLSIITLGLGLTLADAPVARASVFCDIEPTRDGFVALRAGPGRDSPLVRRMKPGDEVMLGQGRQGAWVEVVYWRGGRFASGALATGDLPTATGWMHSALLAKDSCG